MKRLAFPIAAGLCLLGSLGFAQERRLQVGAAANDITPPLGTPIVGGFAPFPAETVHDELLARCIVLDDGATRAAIVVADIIGIPLELGDAVRARIEESTGIPRGNILVAGTHTHSSCRGTGDYQKFLEWRIADLVQIAHSRLRPAEVAFGSVEVPDHVFNRRCVMKEGTAPPSPFGTVDKVKMNPSWGSPDLVEPAGPTDPTVSFVAFREPDGRLISLLAAYSLHYVGGVRRGDLSADYYGVFSKTLEGLQPAPPTPAGHSFVAMMANGTSGDINNNNYGGPRESNQPYEKMTRVGQDIATRVHEALKTAEWKPDADLDARHLDLEAPTRRVDEALVAWAEKTLAEPEKDPSKTSLPRVFAKRVANSAELPATTAAPVHHLRIGDIGIGTFPGETFAETGLAFKERSPLQHAFMISFVNASIGYLPPQRHFELGGYETWPTICRIEPGSVETLFDAVLDLAKQSRNP